ncbi:MAG: hypothetical protein H6835_06855 [Planctomycetes bacterium]|nr:hypothetical protein [Planctomycetota bacterium]
MPATRLLTVALGALAATGLRAQFAEPFDSQTSADVTILQETDTTVDFVDYSNMTVGSTPWSIPEAPRQLAGSLPTRGVLVKVNVTQGFAAAVNIVAGATPITFGGRYRLSFDAWINVPLPVPGGSTEQLLWGVGVDSFAPIEARHNRGAGTAGIWGWLAGDNGYSSEDAVINDGDVAQGLLGDLVTGQGVPFNEAFDSNSLGGPNGCAANTWTRVDIDVDANGTRVYFNGVQFFDLPTAPLPGFAMIGYEDPFSSLGTAPDGQWCLLDNFLVTVPNGCGTLGTAVAQGTPTGGELLIGSAPPALSAPLTLRLRGGPPSFVAFLAAGVPAPFTINVPLGPGCSVDAEIVTMDAVVSMATDSLGSSQFTLTLPDSPVYCGAQLGLQIVWLDLSNPSCLFQVTNGLTTTFGS